MLSSVRVVLAAILLLASGCGRRLFYEWRDEPYLRPCFKAGEQDGNRRMESAFASERDIGCRALSVHGREALRRGDTQTARRIARALMEHYPQESNLSVCSTLIALCLRNVGPGNEEVAAFLKERLARGDMVASAAYTLASLRPAGSYEAIRAAYEATRTVADFELRYELLGAFWLLGDARGIGLFEEALAEIPSTWPEAVHHMKKEMYLRTLGSRLQTLKAACGRADG